MSVGPAHWLVVAKILKVHLVAAEVRSSPFSWWQLPLGFQFISFDGLKLVMVLIPEALRHFDSIRFTLCMIAIYTWARLHKKGFDDIGVYFLGDNCYDSNAQLTFTKIKQQQNTHTETIFLVYVGITSSICSCVCDRVCPISPVPLNHFLPHLVCIFRVIIGMIQMCSLPLPK